MLTVKAQQCSPSFQYTVDSTNTVQFINTSNPIDSLNFSWSLDSNVIDTSINPSYTYSSPGAYYTCLTATAANGNTCTSCDTVYVNFCRLTFNYMRGTFSNNIIDLPFSYSGAPIQDVSFDLGDGNVSNFYYKRWGTQNQYMSEYTYDSLGTFTITLQVTDVFGNTCIEMDTISIDCVAKFNHQVSSNNNVQFTNLSIPVNASSSWQFDYNLPIDTNRNASYQYPFPDVYYPSLEITTSNGKKCLAIDTISVNKCYTYLYTTRKNNTLTLYNSFYGSTAQSVFWDFGDGNTSNQYNTSPLNSYDTDHTYDSSGIFQVISTVTDSFNISCSDTSIVNFELCGANFSKSLDSSISNSVLLSNHSSDVIGTTYRYDFGDGTVIDTNTLNVTHQYQSYGVYYVCLTTSNAQQNCSITYCDSVGLDSLGNLKNGFTVRFVDSNFISIPVGITESNRSQLELIQVYPNPSNGFFNIDVRATTNTLDIEYSLYNAVGQELIGSSSIKETFYTLDLNKYPQGMYYLIFNDGTSRKTHKLIKLKTE